MLIGMEIIATEALLLAICFCIWLFRAIRSRNAALRWTGADTFFVLAALSYPAYLQLESLTGCLVGDAPFSRAPGCYNFGISWNPILTWSICILLVPWLGSLLYAPLRILEITLRLLGRAIRARKALSLPHGL